MFLRGVRGGTYLLSTIRALVRDRDQYDGLLVTTNPPFAGLAGWHMSAVHGLPYVQLVYDVYPDIAEGSWGQSEAARFRPGSGSRRRA